MVNRKRAHKQRQKRQPGIEAKMSPAPKFDNPSIVGSGKLQGKVALITGGDSGIGRATAIAFAKEGADIAIVYLNEHEDAAFTKQEVLSRGRRCLTISLDVGSEVACKRAIARTIKEFGKLDILVNNAAEQHPQEQVQDISEKQLVKTFRTNMFSMFFLTQAALKHLSRGSTIINTTSVTAYRGSGHLLDYASTKGAIVAFTRALASNLVEKGIRVNGVAPGPIWTPLIVSTFKEGQIRGFGKKVPMKRAGQPWEVAYCYVFLASEESNYMTGQVLHPNGGEIVNV